jgi:23S rRNA (uracil1939-C5)-methyltransferase
VARPGDLLTLDIEKPAAGGRMIARSNGQVVLVAGTMPGERVRVKIDRVGKGVTYATTIAVERASASRRTAFCNPECGGTLYAHIAYPEQLAIKAAVIADAFARIGKLPNAPDLSVAASRESGYRMRARLHIRNGRLGFFNEGTHTICDARSTQQLSPEACDAIDRAAALTGALRMAQVEVDVSENGDGSERAVHFEIDGSDSLGGAALSAGLTGISSSRTRRSGTFDLVAGDPHVSDVIAIEGARFTLRRHVLAFFQANRYLFEPLVSHVCAQLDDPPGTLVDLYAGVGLFSVAAACARGYSVNAVEGDAVAAADLGANAQQCGRLVRPVHAAVEDFRWAAPAPPSALLVDPPRTGMSRAALQKAIGLRAPRIVYVSCDVATLARDSRVLVDAGYTLGRLNAFDLFPNTPHVETVAVFDR